jgi:CYTH domain-containing protein
MVEIEKTFLVKTLPQSLSSFTSFRIKQGYISPPPSPLRIRQKGDKFELTKKIPLKEGDFSSAEEINIYLTEFEFKKLWPLVERSLEKTRYLVPLENGLTAELDVFGGELNGLNFVEVEFSSAQQMMAFPPPEWFGRDITQEDFAANTFLAGKKYSEIKGFL